jgi:hypothetical protein
MTPELEILLNDARETEKAMIDVIHGERLMKNGANEVRNIVLADLANIVNRLVQHIAALQSGTPQDGSNG